MCDSCVSSIPSPPSTFSYPSRSPLPFVLLLRLEPYLNTLPLLPPVFFPLPGAPSTPTYSPTSRRKTQASPSLPSSVHSSSPSQATSSSLEPWMFASNLAKEYSVGKDRLGMGGGGDLPSPTTFLLMPTKSSRQSWQPLLRLATTVFPVTNISTTTGRSCSLLLPLLEVVNRLPSSSLILSKWAPFPVEAVAAPVVVVGGGGWDGLPSPPSSSSSSSLSPSLPPYFPSFLSGE